MVKETPQEKAQKEQDRINKYVNDRYGAILEEIRSELSYEQNTDVIAELSKRVIQIMVDRYDLAVANKPKHKDLLRKSRVENDRPTIRIW